MRKDFSRHPGEHIATWLLRCWDSGANSLELEGKEAKQLGSLSTEGGIDKAIGKGEPARSLWRRLLSAIRERYPFKEDVVYRSGKWTTMEKGIQYLRELAVLEVIYGDLNDVRSPIDPDEVQCTRPMWRKLVRNAPPSFANSLAILTWKDQDGPTVNEAASNLREYEESISSSFVSAVEKLSQEFKRFKEDLSYSLPIRTSVSAIRSQRSSAQERGYRGYTPRATLWFYLRDHGEDMRKWDGKPTSTLEARVEERDNQVYWTVWIRWPGTSDPQEYKALVDTGAQCTLMPSSYIGAEPISICGVTGGSQQLTVLEAEVSLTGNEWQKHPIVTGPEALCILGIDYLRRGYFKDPKGYRWAFGIAALETEEIKQLSALPGLSEDPSVVGLLRVKEQQVPIATTMMHRRQYRSNRDSLIPIHELIRRLESQGVISKTCSPFNSPIWPVRKSNGEWRLTVDYRGLNEVTPPLSAAVPDMLELQYDLESKAAKWYATSDIANAFFSIPLAAECRPQFAFTWRGVQYTWNRLPQGWKHRPTICHGLIQTALEQGEAPEHLQYIDDIIVWGNTAEEVFEKGKKIVQILLKAGFAIKQMTRKKNNFKWGPEQRQAFEQIKREIVHAVALGPVQAGQDIKNVLYTAAGENGPTWSLWQKAPGETRGRPLGFWSRRYRGSEARYTPSEKEILAAYEGVRAASEVVGTEAQLLLAPRLPVLGWMFKGRVPCTHHATDATWSKWVALITQRARIGNPNRPGILEVIMDWSDGKDFGISPEEEVTCAEEAPLYNKLPENEKQYALFTDGSCRIVGKHRRWKAAVWSPIRQVVETAEGDEVKAIQLALDIAEREKWPVLCLYTDSWMVANALWGWLQQWKQNNWQRRGKPIWAAALWQDIAARVENLVVKVRHVDAHVPKSRATEEHQNNQQVDQAAKIEEAQVDLDWQHKERIESDNGTHFRNNLIDTWAKEHGIEWVYHIPYHAPASGKIERYNGLLKTTLRAMGGGAKPRQLETYPVPHATARNTILGLEKQVLWRRGTPEGIESDNGTHFRNNLIDTWANEHGIEWGTIKNISFTSSAAIHGCAAACKVAVKLAMFGTAAVSGAVLAFRRR
ncbi:hypothetical protein QYF61_018461 [Mycteria americana]|uniref:ribonuclease H n=1 Tax=Mycteria americana TaxID=33587 RepID=A0AAN7MIJ2_MYCAM|nr:hypothetical protein QYF61_018461 [Mycteria americana]